MQHETDVTVNLDRDEAAAVIRALASEALVQTGRGEDADHFREEARKLAAEVRRQAEMITEGRAENQRLKGALAAERNTVVGLKTLLDEREHARRDADTLTPLNGSPADIAAHVLDLHVVDPGGGQ